MLGEWVDLVRADQVRAGSIKLFEIISITTDSVLQKVGCAVDD